MIGWRGAIAGTLCTFVLCQWAGGGSVPFVQEAVASEAAETRTGDSDQGAADKGNTPKNDLVGNTPRDPLVTPAAKQEPSQPKFTLAGGTREWNEYD